MRMFECLFVKKCCRSFIKYVRNQGNGEGSFKMCTGAYSERGILPHDITYSTTLFLLMFLSYRVLFYLQKFNLTFILKGSVCQKWLFFSNEINFCCNEISFLYFKLFYQTKVSKNAFDFNQKISQVYSTIFYCHTLLRNNPVQRSTETYLINYFTFIFTELVLCYCYYCCYCYLLLLLQQFLN